LSKRIGIIIPWQYIVDRDAPIKGVKFRHFVRFESCTIIGAENSLVRCAIIIYLTHDEFKPIPLGEISRLYYYSDAKKRFPYLFADTNPLLYRKYGT